MTKQFSWIFADITHRCNLRCPFCSNDWTKISKGPDITVSAFDHLMKLLPLVRDTGFGISCAFEPTVHPKFAGLIDRIPEMGKDKLFFTTNMSAYISPYLLDDLSRANLHHINISLDSLDKQTFEELRHGASFTTTMTNIAQLSAMFRYTTNSPQINFIIMALKQNRDEIIDIMNDGVILFPGASFEIRTPFSFSLNHMNQEWKERSTLSFREWEALTARITEAELPFTARISCHYRTKDEEIDKDPDKDPFLFTITSSGLMLQMSSGKTWNLNDIEDPLSFWEKKLEEF